MARLWLSCVLGKEAGTWASWGSRSLEVLSKEDAEPARHTGWISLRWLKPYPQGALQALRGSGGRGAPAPCSPAESTHLGVLEEWCGAVVTGPSGGSTEQSGWRWRSGEGEGPSSRKAGGDGGAGRTFQPEIVLTCWEAAWAQRTWALDTASSSSWGLMEGRGGPVSRPGGRSGAWGRRCAHRRRLSCSPSRSAQSTPCACSVCCYRTRAVSLTPRLPLT